MSFRGAGHKRVYARLRRAMAREPGIHNPCDAVMYHVYMLASGKHGTLYIGVTNNLIRRIYQHRNKFVRGFTAQYDVTRLVWFESYDDPTTAIEREKDLKKWRRDWKIALIEEANPDWDDLYSSILK